MAARLLKRQADRTRDAIQTSQLINRLTDHALGEVELSATQVRAIEVLLRKTLPDLQAIEHTGDVLPAFMSREQIDGMLVSAGLDPEAIWQQLRQH